MNKELVMQYSDVHLRDNGSFLEWSRVSKYGYSKELENTVKGMHFVAQMVMTHKPAMLFMAGDLFHLPESVSTQCLCAAHDGLIKIKRACDHVGTKHWMFPGNHDMMDKRNGLNTLVPFRYYGELILEPTTVELSGHKIRVIPYTDSTGELYTEFVTHSNDSIYVVHADFGGSTYESYEKSKSQLSPELPLKCLAGDIHIPQDVGTVSYSGSLVQNKFFRSDINNVGGTMTYDLSTGELQRQANTLSKHYVKISPRNEKDTSYLKNALKLDPEKCLLSIHSMLSKAEIREMFSNYEHQYFPIHKRIESKEFHHSPNIETPDQLLRDHIRKEKPEVMELVEEMIK